MNAVEPVAILAVEFDDLNNGGSMSRIALWGVIVAALLLSGAAPPADKPTSQETREQLEARVAALQARVRDLERKNESLEDQVHELKMRLSVASSQQIVPDAGRVPDSWQRRRFNGITYYLVPLDIGTPVPTTRPSR